MTDPCEDICDALVTYARALTTPANAIDPANPEVSLVGEIDRTDNPKKALELEYQQLKVLFYATSEAAEKIGRGGECLEHFTVSMLVLRKLDSEYTKETLATYVRELKKKIRGVSMAGCPWSEDATPVKTDPEQLNQHQQFCSISDFTYSSASK